MNYLLILLALMLLSACNASPVHPDAATGLASPLAMQDVRPSNSDPNYTGRPLSTMLTGAQEVPGPGDPDGRGHVSLSFNYGQAQVCFVLSVEGIETATAAHIHQAPAGQAGPIVVNLAAPAGGSSSGCTSADAQLVKDIGQNPSKYYVNVHNAPFPDGALRGQLSK